MNDPITELEQELRELVPAKPPEGFVNGICEALGDQGNLAVINHAPEDGRKVLAFPKRLNWGVAAAAALVAGILGASKYFQKQSSEKLANTQVEAVSPAAPEEAPAAGLAPTPANWQPTDRKTILVDVQEGGVIRSPEEPPSQLIRYKYLDTTTYQGTDPQSRMQMAVPREQVVRVKLEPY